MSKVKRIAAWIVCIGLILALFASSAYIAQEADHDCVGEHCEICQRIQAVLNLLRVTGLLVLSLLALFAMRALSRALHRADGLRPYARHTLVSWKIRLDN